MHPQNQTWAVCFLCCAHEIQDEFWFCFLSRYQHHIFYHQWSDTEGSKVLDTDMASESRTLGLRKVQTLECSGHLKLNWMYSSAISQYLTEEMYEAACGQLSCFLHLLIIVLLVGLKQLILQVALAQTNFFSNGCRSFSITVHHNDSREMTTIISKSI